MAQAGTANTSTAPGRRHSGGTGRRGAPASRRVNPPPRVHAGRLAVLALVLIAAALYVQPLRSFFGEQSRYQQESDSLAAARSDNAALKRQLQLLTTKSYIAQVARDDSMLVPRGMQVFVVKGLPGEKEEAAVAAALRGREPVQSSFSVVDRLEDLWRTLLR
jgi:hypothetical protein